MTYWGKRKTTHERVYGTLSSFGLWVSTFVVVVVSLYDDWMMVPPPPTTTTTTTRREEKNGGGGEESIWEKQLEELAGTADEPATLQRIVGKSLKPKVMERRARKAR